MQGFGAIAYPQAVFCPTIGGIFLFESFDVRAQDILAGWEDLRNGGGHFVFDLSILAGNVFGGDGKIWSHGWFRSGLPFQLGDVG